MDGFFFILARVLLLSDGKCCGETDHRPHGSINEMQLRHTHKKTCPDSWHIVYTIHHHSETL